MQRNVKTGCPSNKTNMKTLFISLVLLLLTAGCRKNTNTAIPDSSFPNDVGDTWHYLVYDTTTVSNAVTGTTQYSLDVSIVADTTLPGGIIATVWQYQYPDHIDTSFVVQKGDTIQFLYDEINLPLMKQYIVPFKVNSSWPYALCDLDKVTVTEKTSKQVLQRTFQNAFHLTGNAGCPDAVFSIDEWIAGNIGIVKSYYNPFGELLLTKHITNWLLVSYSLRLKM